MDELTRERAKNKTLLLSYSQGFATEDRLQIAERELNRLREENKTLMLAQFQKQVVPEMSTLNSFLQNLHL